jgi:hypothetical protein
VEIPAQPAALLFPGYHQTLTGALQVGGQADRLGGRPGLPGQILQPHVGLGEGFARCTKPDHQAAHGLALIDQRQVDARGEGRNLQALLGGHDRRIRLGR